jgi:IS6 family transposase
MRRRYSRVPAPRSNFAGLRFPPEVITLVVRWYLRLGFPAVTRRNSWSSGGITVDHVSVYRWVQRFTRC